MLSRNIDRLRAEEDVRNLQVARASQADGEAVKAFMEGLQLRIGRPVVTEPPRESWRLNFLRKR
ncbi:hypothetical protein HHJ44_25235 (plasmid) [Escherichia coli]|nr:hypothetical protein HHJ44_25235 [Escherichia coli]